MGLGTASDGEWASWACASDMALFLVRDRGERWGDEMGPCDHLSPGTGCRGLCAGTTKAEDGGLNPSYSMKGQPYEGVGLGQRNSLLA
jgi:hypothetical protein